MLKVFKRDDAFFYSHNVNEVLLSKGFDQGYECCPELPLGFFFFLAAWFDAQLPL